MSLSELYSKAAEIINEGAIPSAKICEVYRIVEDLPVMSRIPPVLVCMTRLVTELNLKTSHFKH